MAKKFKESKVTMKQEKEEGKGASFSLKHVTESADAESIVEVREAVETLMDEPFTQTTMTQIYTID
ncbi:hypothetical protein JDW15_04165 [Aerococcaceae bacterium zg-ZJ1578]|uniref:DUF1659 domain-containing protein n=1 Tax=Aerococcaceae bacterium zg-252 TaxID=2796928 RepID=UPI001A34EFFE|nr:hypothetical protein [Aerococcaceae bacterium zg-1578]